MEETEYDKQQRKEKVEEARKAAREICKKHPEIGQAGGALIFARQIYRIARFEINRMLTEHIKDPDVCVYAEEILVQAWAEAGDKSGVNAEMATTLVSGLQGTVLPFCENFRALRRRTEQDEFREMSKAAEAERRDRSLPLGFNFGANSEQSLHRGKTLCLVGVRPVVEWVMSEAVSSILASKNKFRVAHLSHWARPNVIEDIKDTRARGSINVPFLRWKGCTDSNNRWKGLIKDCESRLGGSLDVVVVDDAAATFTAGLVGGSSPYKSANAHKVMRRWADAAGCGLVIGALCEHDPASEGGPDLTTPAFENLRTFTTLRPVWTKPLDDEDGKVEIWLGKDAHRWVVSEEVIS